MTRKDMTLRHPAPRLAAIVAVLALFGAACNGDPDPKAAQTSPSPSPAPSSTGPAERGITQPDGKVRVDNVAHGHSRRLVARAVGDLKAVGLWRPLTKHLFVVKLNSRLGRENVPDDGHLADVYLTAIIEDGVGGSLCDVMFFPTAMSDDLDRWRSYHAQGFLADPPPSLRQFWASILAHELAHCLDHGKGEPVAERWEAKALESVREAGLS